MSETPGPVPMTDKAFNDPLMTTTELRIIMSRMERDLATLRRKLAEAEVNLSESNLAMVRRYYKAILEACPAARCASVPSVAVRILIANYLDFRRVAGELAAYVNSQTPDCLDAFKTRERLLAAYRALTADGPTPPSASPPSDSSR